MKWKYLFLVIINWISLILVCGQDKCAVDRCYSKGYCTEKSNCICFEPFRYDHHGNPCSTYTIACMFVYTGGRYYCRQFYQGYMPDCRFLATKECEYGNPPLYEYVVPFFNYYYEYTKSANFVLTVNTIGVQWFDTVLYSNSFYLSADFRDFNAIPRMWADEMTQYLDKQRINKQIYQFIEGSKRGYPVTRTIKIYDTGVISLWHIAYGYNLIHEFILNDYKVMVYQYFKSPQLELNYFALHLNKFEVYYFCTMCIEPTIRYGVEENTDFSYTWKLRTYGGDEEKPPLKMFAETSSKLTVPAHKYFIEGHSNDRFLLIWELKEHYQNYSAPNHVLRIYTIATHLTPTAHIYGNNIRGATVNESILLDATASKDYNQFNTSNEYVRYSWTCKSDDGSSWCKNINSNAATLQVPTYTLTGNMEYRFTVNVSSRLNHKSAIFTQTIRPTTTQLLTSHINCIRGCKNNMYNEFELLHLLAECRNCKETEFKYEWSVNMSKLGTKRRLIILNQDIKKYVKNRKITITLKIISATLTGLSILELDPTPSDRQFFCQLLSNTISNDLELTKPYSIKCDQKHYWYFFYANSNELIHQTTYGETNYLKIHYTTHIQARGCTKYGSCYMQNIKVVLEKENIITSAKKLNNFMYNTKNYTRKIMLGAHSDAASLFVFAAKQLQYISDKKENYALAVKYFRIVEEFDLISLTKKHQAFTMYAEIFFGTRNIDLQFLYNITKFYEKNLLDLFNHNIIANDLCKTSLYDFKIFSRNIYAVFHKIIVSFGEKKFGVSSSGTTSTANYYYSNYGDVSFIQDYDTPKFILVTKQMKTVMHYLAAVASNLQFTGEPVIEHDFQTVWQKIVFLDIENLKFIRQQIRKVTIFLSESLQRECFMKLKQNDELTMHIVTMEKNMHLWEYGNSRAYTDIVYIHFVNGGTSEERLQLNSDDMLIKTKDFHINFNVEDIKQYVKKFEQFVSSKFDRVMYDITIPGYSAALIHIYDVTNVVDVYHKLRRKPVVRKDKSSLASKGSSRVIPMDNDSEESTNGYVILAGINSDLREKWILNYCRMRFVENDFNMVQCYCSHLTAFAVGAPKFKVVVNKYSEPQLQTTKEVMFLLGTIAIIFTAMLILTYALTRHSKEMMVIPSICKLGDYKYYVTFFTGLEDNAGTTANITIHLYGTENDDTFILYRTLFRNKIKNGTAVTVMFLTRCLGHILRIHVSHDNYGCSPSWYLNTVRIKDYAKKLEYVFVVRQWLSLLYNNKIECNVKLISEREICDKSILRTEYINYVFSNNEFFMIQYHARLSPLKKLTILFTSLMTLIFVIAVCFKKSVQETFQIEEIDSQNLMFPIKYIMYSFLGAGISIATSALLVILFRSKKSDTNYKLAYMKIEV